MTTCPGCGLEMPPTTRPAKVGYYNCSAECWTVFEEVLEREYSNAVLFGAVHQFTVDAYAVQHAGGPHPDKSVAVHFAGLHLAFARGVKAPYIAPLLQQMASHVTSWPHFELPNARVTQTIADVAMSDDHITGVREWAREVYESWSQHHAAIEDLLSEHVKA